MVNTDMKGVAVQVLLGGVVALVFGVIGVIGVEVVGGSGDGLFVTRGIVTGINVGVVLVDVVEGV